MHCFKLNTCVADVYADLNLCELGEVTNFSKKSLRVSRCKELSGGVSMYQYP